MRIEIRLFGSLASSLSSSLAGLQRPGPGLMDLPEGSTVADACGLLGITDASGIVALLDGGPAGPGSPLHDGARLELLPIVEGG